MMSDTTGDSRKVDKKTALALWESTVLPQGVRKKREETDEEDNSSGNTNVMNFTIVTKRGNKQQVCPISSFLKVSPNHCADPPTCYSL
jgi:regulator of nonsense transcripts 2